MHEKEGKKGSDKGIDGTIVFIDDASGKAKRAKGRVKADKFTGNNSSKTQLQVRKGCSAPALGF